MRIRNCNQPLWMPRGSIRSILALSLVGGSVVAAFVDKNAAELLLPAAGVTLGFYFKERGAKE